MSNQEDICEHCGGTIEVYKQKVFTNMGCGAEETETCKVESLCFECMCRLFGRSIYIRWTQDQQDHNVQTESIKNLVESDTLDQFHRNLVLAFGCDKQIRAIYYLKDDIFGKPIEASLLQVPYRDDYIRLRLSHSEIGSLWIVDRSYGVTVNDQLYSITYIRKGWISSSYFVIDPIYLPTTECNCRESSSGKLCIQGL